MSDSNLKKALVRFREDVICAETPDDPASRKFGLLRRAMVDHLVEWKPESAVDWWYDLPPRLRDNTERDQFNRYGLEVIAIVRRHSLVRKLVDLDHGA